MNKSPNTRPIEYAGIYFKTQMGGGKHPTQENIEDCLRNRRSYLDLSLKSPLPPAQKRGWVQTGAARVREAWGLAEEFELHPDENLLKKCNDLMRNEQLKPIIEEVDKEQEQMRKTESEKTRDRGLSHK